MKYALRGTIVTFNARKQVIKDGYVGIDGKKISFVRSTDRTLPKDFKVIDANGYIYPGLIDLHNHLSYNFLDLWNIDKKYIDRDQWRREARYKREIGAPAKLLANTNGVEVVKYAEVKALVGGVTSIGGLARFDKAYAAWLLRNIEVEKFDGKDPKIYQSVLRLIKEKDFADADKKMKEGSAFIYHLAEGTSTKLHEEYTDLEKHNLLRDKLVGIHCTALTEEQWKELGRKNVKLVWSPLSNFLLYGSTTNVIAAKKHRILICLGSDWSPTGSKSLLWELKVADLINKELGIFTDRELVEMVTINPAKAVRLDDKIGKVARDHYADIVVFDNIEGDPYRNLINATEKNLRLSIIDGKPRYGEPEILEAMEIRVPEKISVGDRTKGISILQDNVKYGDMMLAQVKANLEATLANPIERVRRLLRMPERPPRLILIEEEDTLSLEAFASMRDEMNMPSKLDSLTMHDDEDFFETLKSNTNAPPYLINLKKYVN